MKKIILTLGMLLISSYALAEVVVSIKYKNVIIENLECAKPVTILKGFKKFTYSIDQTYCEEIGKLISAKQPYTVRAAEVEVDGKSRQITSISFAWDSAVYRIGFK